MRRKLPNARDSMGIVFNFFDFWAILFNRPQDRTGFNLRKAIDFCNRHTPPGKKVGLHLDFDTLFPKQ